MTDISGVLEVLKLAERIKREGRHCWYPDGRRESVAEHTWRMSLIAMLVYRDLKQPVNIERTLKMIIIHDLVEAEVGDIPIHEVSERQEQKAAAETAAVKRIGEILDSIVGDEVVELWFEFERCETAEAQLAKALDRLEAQLAHAESELETWEIYEYAWAFREEDFDLFNREPVLLELYSKVTQQNYNKLVAAGFSDAAADIKRRAATAGLELISP